LELIWVLEGTLALQPEQARLLDRVMAGPCVQASAVAPPPDALRRPPPMPRDAGIAGDSTGTGATMPIIQLAQQ